MADLSKASAGSPDRTICILLGSSDFPSDPNHKDFMQEALAQAHKDFREYLSSPRGLALPQDNICDLFGSPSNYLAQRHEIIDFLKRQNERLGGTAPIDCIVYFWGHGYFADDQTFHLAIKGYQPDDPEATGFPVKLLQSAFKGITRSMRRYWFFDCCYAEAATSGSLDATVSARATQGRASDNLHHSELAEPESGSATLMATDRDNRAWIFRSNRRPLFTDLLMYALEQSSDEQPTQLSLKELEGRMRSLLKERLADQTTFHDYRERRIVEPQCVDRDRAAGAVSELKIFPMFRRAEPEPGRKIADLIALKADKLACLLVEAECENKDFGFEASAALIEHQAELAITSGLQFDPEAQIRTISVTDAVDGEAKLLETVKALCRADLAVFDVTGFQPGVMLLLGIRSVVRRGVTICTIDSPDVEDYRAKLPYCLQVLNVCSYTAGNGRAQPREIIAQKAVDGFRESMSNPFYLDLPAFDAVRRFGSDTDKYRPIPYEQQVLFLCPFSSEYLKSCWDASIARVFRRCLIQRHNRLNRGRVHEGIHPELRRLLDRGSSQIVSQSLYEALRRSQMCVADWTNLRPNLFFELGVRLAVNKRGAIHIVADGKLDAKCSYNSVDTESFWGDWPCDPELQEEVSASAQLRQVRWLSDIFKPIEYSVGATAEVAYERMLDEYFLSDDKAPKVPIYRTIAAAIEKLSLTADVHVARSLIQSASTLGGTDAFNNFSVVLHGDESREIRKRKEIEALERKMAAWLYMDARQGMEHIVADAASYLAFEGLSLDILLEGQTLFPQQLIAKVEERYQAIHPVAPAAIGPSFGHLNLHLQNIIKRSKLLKSEKNHSGAIDVLRGAIDLIRGSAWPISDKSRDKQTSEQRKLATVMSDAHGMIGGHFRRLNRPSDALESFKAGRAYERNPVFGITSSYNSVNCLVVEIEQRPQSQTEMGDDIGQTVEFLSWLTQGVRSEDAWAWADLGTCHTLSMHNEDIDAAKAAFSKFILLSSRESIGSPLSVLESMHDRQSRAGVAFTAKTQAVVDFLREEIAK